MQGRAGQVRKNKNLLVLLFLMFQHAADLRTLKKLHSAHLLGLDKVFQFLAIYFKNRVIGHFNALVF